ncbi:LysE/ArgO family amino acid transporter [Nocardia wallacei]|uniref:LysE/ArgO family amino acid transporter n=1 Tax=Nocardia wallacei TaxID=480035 RepID=UPI00313D61C6
MNTSSALTAALSGLGFGLSLIVAIGAQNAFVLRQGIRGEHILPVIAVCAVSDVVLIAAGVGGLGALIASAPTLLMVTRYAGAAFLLGYAALAVRRAVFPGVMTTANAASGTTNESLTAGARTEPPQTTSASGTSRTATMTAMPGAVTDTAQRAPIGTVEYESAGARRGTSVALGATVLTCLALTWLNPHVYLDTVVLLGSFANTYAGQDRWFLAAGAMLASILWFTALGYGGRLLAPLFARRTAWRILDSAIALIMLTLALTLLLP